MAKFITKPNSKFDDRFLFGVSVWSYFIFAILLSSVITTWWLVLLLDFLFVSILMFITLSLYQLRYNKNFVELRLYKKVSNYIIANYSGPASLFDIPKACKIIDEICKATIVPIEERKLLFDKMCLVWLTEGHAVPNFIVEKWKRAQVEYRKFEIENE